MTIRGIAGSLAIGAGLCAGAAGASTVSGFGDVETLTDIAPDTPRAGLGGTGKSTGTGFDIDLNFVGTPTADQIAAFGAAEAFWERRITGYRNGFTMPIGSQNPDGGVRIDAVFQSIDGPGNTLAQAGPDTGFENGTFIAVNSGLMAFDTADLGAFASQFELIVRHEMAHVLGWGVLWSDLNVAAFPNQTGPYVTGSGQYTGGALSTYQAECDPLATFVPVELDGGPGTANGHWDETSFACGDDDLLTGYLDTGDNPVSRTTLAAFHDIGLTISPVPAPMTLVLGLSALGALGAVAGRRRRPAA